jgi:hypothetical protein
VYIVISLDKDILVRGIIMLLQPFGDPLPERQSIAPPASFVPELM